MQHIDVIPTGDALGAEVRGANIAKPLVDDVVAEIRQAFLDHLVVFLHHQDITPQQQLAFAQRFGELQTLVRCDSCAPLGHVFAGYYS